jgi:hypothetical protein
MTHANEGSITLTDGGCDFHLGRAVTVSRLLGSDETVKSDSCQWRVAFRSVFRRQCAELQFSIALRKHCPEVVQGFRRPVSAGYVELPPVAPRWHRAIGVS